MSIMAFRKFKSIFPFSFMASAAADADLKGLEAQLKSLKLQLAEVETEEGLKKVFEKLDRQSQEQNIKCGLKYDYGKGHMQRNRYCDIFPYNRNRVKLKDTSDDYINASYVKHENTGLTFIVAQGPLPNTRDHFWQMVAENRSPVVFMLNQPSLHDSVHYFPTKSGETLHLKEWSIKLEETVSDTETFVIRRLKIMNGTVGHTVIHAHYTGWPDLGVPDPHAFVTFVNECRKSGLVKNADNLPPVIHCTAGIGRSGVFLVVNVCMELLLNEGLVDELSVSQLVLQLRKERMWLIQTPPQYRFTLKVLVDMIENDQLH